MNILLFRKINTLYECTGYPQVGCSDLDTECQYWAVRYNYCNLGWMKKYCCASCQEQAMCHDGFDSCESRASRGECYEGTWRNWMFDNCKKSCGYCD